MHVRKKLKFSFCDIAMKSMYDVIDLYVGVNKCMHVYAHACVSARTHNHYSQILGVGFKASKFMNDSKY